METLAHIISQNYTILSDFDAEDAAAPLLYTDNAENSHIIKSLPADVVHDLQNSPIAMENHVKVRSSTTLHGHCAAVSARARAALRSAPRPSQTRVGLAEVVWLHASG